MHGMRNGLAAAAAALALAIGPAAAEAGEAARVAIALEKDLGKTVEDALLDARMTLAREPAPAAPRIAALAANEVEAATCARSLYFAGTAEALVVGAARVSEERETETGAVALVEVTLDAWGGRSGERLLHVVQKDRGMAADPARALAKAKRLASAAAAKRLSEEIQGALERSSLALEIAIDAFPLDDRAYHGAALERALARAGIQAAAQRVDREAGRLVIDARAREGSIDDVEVRLRAALDAEGLRALASTRATGPGALGLRYEGPRERPIEVRVAGIDPTTNEANGPAIAAAIAAIPGVHGVEREYTPGLLVVRARTRGPVAAIDGAIAAARAGLRLTRIGPDEVEYQVRGEAATFLVDLRGFEAEKIVEAGRAVDDACRDLPGILDYERTRDPAAGAMRLRLRFRGPEHDLDAALLGALERAGLRSIPTSPEPGTDLAYRLGRARSRAVKVRVERLSPEAYACAGRALVAVIATLDGVRIAERRYDADAEVLELSVAAGESSAEDLDLRIWAAAREASELKHLAPGTSAGSTIGYRMAADAPEGERAITLRVENLAREAYESDGLRLLEVVRGLDGATAVDAVYEGALRRLRVTLRYPRPARDFEAALWDALPRRRLWHAVTGPPFSRALSPDRRDGGVVRIVFGEPAGAAAIGVEVAASDGDAFHGHGRGWFVSPSGIVLAPLDAVERASAVRVRLADGRTLAAVVIATDPVRRLATLRVQGDGFPAIDARRAEALCSPR